MALQIGAQIQLLAGHLVAVEHVRQRHNHRLVDNLSYLRPHPLHIMAARPQMLEQPLDRALAARPHVIGQLKLFTFFVHRIVGEMHATLVDVLGCRCTCEW